MGIALLNAPQIDIVSHSRLGSLLLWPAANPACCLSSGQHMQPTGNQAWTGGHCEWNYHHGEQRARLTADWHIKLIPLSYIFVCTAIAISPVSLHCYTNSSGAVFVYTHHGQLAKVVCSAEDVTSGGAASEDAHQLPGLGIYQCSPRGAALSCSLCPCHLQRNSEPINA